jgi:hemerythrin-like domain-containing protein
VSLLSSVFGRSNKSTDDSAAEPVGDLILAEWFAHDHRACDTAWVEVESAVDDEAFDKAAERFAVFSSAMTRHLAWEEQVLFPAFEDATGMRGGPTFVMRSEHDQMRGLLRMMEEAVSDESFDDVLEHGDTLLMLIQQHNQKEEGMLYPMSERVLGDRWHDIRQQCLSLNTP